MFIKIGKTRINLDNVSNLWWEHKKQEWSADEIEHAYFLHVEYATDATGEMFRFDTAEEWEKARKILDYAIKPLDLKPGA